MKPVFTPETAARFVETLAAYRAQRAERDAARVAFETQHSAMEVATLAAYPGAYDDIEAGVTAQAHRDAVSRMFTPDVWAAVMAAFIAYDTLAAHMPPSPDHGGIFSGTYEAAALQVLSAVA